MDRLPAGVINVSPRLMILSFVGLEKPETPKRVEKLEKEEKEKESKEKEKESKDYGLNGLRKKETMTTTGGRLERSMKKTPLQHVNQHLRQLRSRRIMRI